MSYVIGEEYSEFRIQQQKETVTQIFRGVFLRVSFPLLKLYSSRNLSFEFFDFILTFHVCGPEGGNMSKN